MLKGGDFMRTAYDCLRTAVIKDFGKWYSHEWWAISEEGKEKVKAGTAYSHFGNPFLSALHGLFIGEDVIRGKLGYGVFDFEDEYEENIEKLKSPFVFHWFVYSSFSFDEWVELRGFRTKKAAINFYKKVKKNRADGLFYTFWFKY